MAEDASSPIIRGVDPAFQKAPGMIRCYARIVCLVTFASLALASQANADIMPPTNRHHDTVCNARYDPVCGELNGKRKTYSNDCFARGAGAKVIAVGECGQNEAPHP
jgi:Kazal-type serine protease inhibitor domain